MFTSTKKGFPMDALFFGVVGFVVYILEVTTLREILNGTADYAELSEGVGGENPAIPARQDVTDRRATHAPYTVLTQQTVPDCALLQPRNWRARAGE
jgi:hypothetical protein